MSGPLVSIGMPVYNGERFLCQSLDAIGGQTYKNFELVICDNGSTDRSAEICREYARADSRIRFLQNESNLGATRNFNRVFELSRGPYFRWAPADDVFAPDSLEHCVAILEQNREVVLCYPKTLLIDDKGAVIRPYDDNLNLRHHSPAERFRSAMNRIGLVNVMYGLVRSDALRGTGLMGNYPGGDIPLVLELTLFGQFWEVSTTHFYRRLHAQASSSIRGVETAQEFWDPETKGRFFPRMMTYYSRYLHAIVHTPLRFSERLRLAGVISRSAIASRHTLFRELHCVVAQSLSARPASK